MDLNEARQTIRKRLFGLIFEQQSSPYWITRGTTHRYGYDGPSGFVVLANIIFNESTNTFDAYSIDAEGNEKLLGTSGDLTKARAMVLAIQESKTPQKRIEKWDKIL